MLSDEFIKLATKEIKQEISELKKILLICQNDVDILSNADKFQKHTHKIKGLAPMMGKEDLGDFSSILDAIFKKMADGVLVEGIFNATSDSIFSMKQSMTDSGYDFGEIKTSLSQILSNLN